MQTKIVLRQVTTATVDLVTLRHSPGDDFDSGADRQAVALRSRQFETDPVAARDALILQDHRGAVDIADHHVDIPGVEKITDGESAGYALLEERRPRLAAGITKRSVLLIHAEQLRLAITGAGRQRIHLRVNVARYGNQIQPSIVIQVGEGGAPFDERQGRQGHARGVRYVGEIPIAVVAVKKIVLVRKVGDVERWPAGVEVIADGDAHGSLLGAVFADSRSGFESDVGKFSVT